MAIEPRVYIKNDKKIPASMSGDAGKSLVVNPGETEYQHEFAGATTAITGVIIMWPTNVPPTGFLMCDGVERDTAQYPALSAILGESSPGKFQTPYIVFPKNSFGGGTLTQEPADVGTHGHTTDDAVEHQHGVVINSAQAHQHRTRDGAGNTHGITTGNDQSVPTAAYGYSDPAGAHGHVVGANLDGLTEPAEGGATVINDYVGVNQPACTLLTFCIKT